MILRARAVVTMDGPPIENGAVVINSERITEVGRWPDLTARGGHEVIDLEEVALLPGLINAHCHLDYTVLRGSIPPPSSFSAWIESINERKASITREDYRDSIEDGLAEAADFGTTTIANLEAFPELIAQLRKSPLRTWWFAEMIDVRAPVDAGAVLEGLDQSVNGSSARGGIGLAPHAPYTASKALYADCGRVTQERKIPVTTHLAESTEEMQMFRDGEGQLFEFLRSIGRPMGDCGQMTPLGYMLQNDLLNERWIVAHLNELTAGDFRLLENAPRFSVVHCPRSHAYFGHSPFPLKKLQGLGFTIALGTDSLASNSELSLFAEMRQLAQTEPSLSAEEILRMATVNGANALGQSENLGRIRAGHLADLLAIPFTGSMDRVADEIVTFRGPVPWLMINGEIIRS